MCSCLAFLTTNQHCSLFNLYQFMSNIPKLKLKKLKGINSGANYKYTSVVVLFTLAVYCNSS